MLARDHDLSPVFFFFFTVLDDGSKIAIDCVGLCKGVSWVVVPSHTVCCRCMRALLSVSPSPELLRPFRPNKRAIPGCLHFQSSSMHGTWQDLG